MSGRSRYPGTRPFADTPEDRSLFFGRTAEIEQLSLRVLSVPLLVQFGRSGLGKTSLLQAGLFPRLRQRAFLPVMVRLNVRGEPPAVTAGRSIDQACEQEGLEPPRAREATLGELLQRTTLWRGDLLLTPVLVFDQFEEVFTLHEPGFRSRVAAEIGALFEHGSPKVKVVISLREDFLGPLEELSAGIPRLFHERLRVEPLGEAAAREAIVEPARLQDVPGAPPFRVRPFAFEGATVDRMIEYLRGKFGVIEPFQLQLLCRHAEVIAGRRQTAGGPQAALAPRDFEGTAGFDHVLRDFYRGTLKELSPTQRRRARLLCEDGLLDRAGHRLMLEEDQIHREFGVRRESLSILAQERVLRRERRQESLFYEISHDRLAESIQQSRPLRVPRRLRRTLWTLGVAIPLLVGALVLRVGSLDRARSRLETERVGAERFVGELLSGAAPPLRQLEERTKEYLGSADPAEALNRSRALSRQAEAEVHHGTLAAVAESYRKALAALPARSSSAAVMRETARVQARLAEALLDQGSPSAARAQIEGAIRTWEAVGATGDRDPDDCTHLASALIALAELRERTGEVKGALSTGGEAIRSAMDGLLGRHGCGESRIVIRPNPEGTVVLLRAVMLRARLLDLPEDRSAAVRLAAEVRRLRPPSGGHPSALASGVQPGPGAARALVAGLDAQPADPADRVWQRERSLARLSLGEALLGCRAVESSECRPVPPLPETGSVVLDALFALDGLAASDPSNRALTADRIRGLLDESQVLAAGGKVEEQAAALQKAEELAGAPANRADLEVVRNAASIQRRRADALNALGRGDEARKLLEEAVNAVSKALALNKDHPRYALELAEARALKARLLHQRGEEEAAQVEQRASAQLVARAQQTVRELSRAPQPVGEGEPAMLEAIEALPGDCRGYDRLRSEYERRAGGEGGQMDAWNGALHAGQLASALDGLGCPGEMKVRLRRTLGAAGRSLARNGRLEDAVAVREEEVALATELARADPRREELLRGLTAARFGLAAAAREAHRPGWEEAKRAAILTALQAAPKAPRQKGSDCQRALQWFKQLQAADPDDPDTRDAVRELGDCQTPLSARSGL
jgi:tetratricopeptide (TPR) repeat protein